MDDGGSRSRWTAGPAHFLGGVLTVVFLGAGAAVGIAGGIGSSPVLTAVFYAIWGSILAGVGLAWLRTAVSVRLDAGGAVVARAPLRVLRTDLTRLRALRHTDPSRTGSSGYVLETADGEIRLPDRLVDTDLAAALRTRAPGMTLPDVTRAPRARGLRRRLRQAAPAVVYTLFFLTVVGLWIYFANKPNGQLYIWLVWAVAVCVAIAAAVLGKRR